MGLVLITDRRTNGACNECELTVNWHIRIRSVQSTQQRDFARQLLTRHLPHAEGLKSEVAGVDLTGPLNCYIVGVEVAVGAGGG